MADWKRLTLEAARSNTPIDVNIDQLMYMERREESNRQPGTYLFFVGGGSLVVRETPDQIRTGPSLPMT